MAGKVRIMVGVRPEYRAVKPVGQEREKQPHGSFPAEESGPQIGPIRNKIHLQCVSYTSSGAFRAFLFSSPFNTLRASFIVFAYKKRLEV